MILLDTNIVSETMRPRPDHTVIAWLNQLETTSLFISTITVAEIEYGLALLADGERKTDLEGRFQRYITEGFTERVLSFDIAAADEYGTVMATRRSTGRPMSSLDGQIAAIARAHGFTLATQNEKDFEACGIEVVNPFTAGTAPDTA